MASLKELYLDIIAGGASLTALCDAVSQKLGNPVALTLPTRTIIARSRSYNNELVEEYTSANMDMTPEEQQENHNLIQRRLMTRRAFIGLYPYLRHKRMNCGCFWKGNLLAVIDVPIVHKVVIEDALKALEEAAAVFTPAIILNGGIPNGIVDPMESHLIGLLKGDIQPGCQQVFQYNIPIHHIEQWQLIWAVASDISFLPDLTGQLYAFCSTHQSIWCTRWSDGLVILIDADKLELLHELSRQLPEIICSVSEPFKKLTDAAKILLPVQFSLHLAQYENPDIRIVFAQNYKIPMFFLSHVQSAQEQEYKSFLLEQIHHYDKTHNSVYFETLRAYLLNNMDINKIAAALNIHRNTVTYRLQRIEELFNISLSDCRVITELYLSLFTEMIPTGNGTVT